MREQTLSHRKYFNPRAPCGARPIIYHPHPKDHGISTHAPLAGRDHFPRYPHLCAYPFQPTRPLRGATQIAFLIQVTEVIFQPTRPLRGATTATGNPTTKDTFQPTRPLRGATVVRVGQWIYKANYFNPRAPCGARLALFRSDRGGVNISTHAPLAGRDFHSLKGSAIRNRISTHAPLAGRDLIPAQAVFLM